MRHLLPERRHWTGGSFGCFELAGLNWYNPRTYQTIFAGRIIAGKKKAFTSPDSREWVLRLGD